ncbi:MAG TPA: ABC transporter transmembrane domain-containing protein, partial [Anaerolineaceae bacterium]
MSIATRPTTRPEEKTAAQPKKTNLFWRCYRFLLPYWPYQLGIYIAEALIVAFNTAIPQFIRWIIDNGIRMNNRTLLAESVGALLGLTLLKGVATFFQGRWTEVASQSVAYDLRNAIQRKLTLLSFSFHDQSETGQLLSRAVQDVERIRFLTGRATLRIVDSVVLGLATAIILITMNPRLALLVILTLPLLGYRAFYLGARLRPLSVAIQNQLGVLTTRLEQNLRGARVVKAFAQEPQEIARFSKENEAWFDLSKTSSRIQNTNGPLLDFIANLGALAIILYGGSLVIQNQLTLGQLVAFSTYLGQLYTPIRQMGNVIPALAQALSSAGRIFEILDAVADVHDVPGAQPLPPIKGSVRFENVSFAYSGTRTVLDSVNLEMQPGQIIA